jgi:hypothetical protein
MHASIVHATPEYRRAKDKANMPHGFKNWRLIVCDLYQSYVLLSNSASVLAKGEGQAYTISAGIMVGAVAVLSVESLRCSWHRRCWRGRSIFAVGFFNLGSHFLEALPLIDHLHHVTRDPYTDGSAKTHSIE